jgi:hypothetical protein
MEPRGRKSSGLLSLYEGPHMSHTLITEKPKAVTSKAVLALCLALYANSSILLGQTSQPEESQPKPQPMSFNELFEDMKTDEEGRAESDSITKLPEISTLFGIGRRGKVGVAIGIELFRPRNRPRNNKWKLELQFADDEVSMGFGRIVVPVVNFTVGPYIGYDFEEDNETFGLRFGIFKF